MVDWFLAGFIAFVVGELHHGKRSHGGQKKRFKDTLKASLKSCNIDPENWESIAGDRSAWRRRVRDGATAYVQKRLRYAAEKRLLRKSKAGISSSPGRQSDLCLHCNRQFRARIGLIGHLPLKLMILCGPHRIRWTN